MTDCTLHRVHAPKLVASTELHHVVPQAWQHHVLLSDKLYDPRTVAICPTGHRNVHAHIVTMMKALEAAGSNDPLVAWKALGRRTAEAKCAYEALTRYSTAARPLLELCSLKLYGYA